MYVYMYVIGLLYRVIWITSITHISFRHHLYVYVYLYVCMYVCMCVCIYIYVCKCVCIYGCVLVCMYVCVVARQENHRKKLEHNHRN
jgi:hypothetical protein